MSRLLFEDESYKIRGAVFQVYQELGCGFLEAVYQECLEREFEIAAIPFVPQEEVIVEYRGIPLIQKYRADFVCYNKIIVEVKAVKELDDIHTAQVINYLKATGFKLGLLVNFGSYPKAVIKRIVLEKKNS